MKTLSSSLLQLTSLCGTALAHYKWPALIINGAVTGDHQCVRSNTNNINPLLDINSLDLRCNEGGLASGGATQTADVNAGARVGHPFITKIQSLSRFPARIHIEQRDLPRRPGHGVHGQSPRKPV